MQEFDVQKLYRPVLHQKIPDAPKFDSPDFEDSYEYVWWKEQKRRCKYGWVAPDGQYLTPWQYFGLNFVKLDFFDNDGTRQVSQPIMYFEQDRHTIEFIYKNRQVVFGTGQTKLAKDIAAVKARGMHWTYNAVVIMMQKFIIEGENMAYVSPEDGMTAEFKQLFLSGIRNLHPFWKPVKLSPDNVDKVGYGKIDPDTGEVVTRNYMLFKAVSKPELVGCLRSLRLSFVWVDEAGRFKFDYLSKFLTASKDTCGLGTQKFGQMVIGGTSDKVGNASMDFEDFYFDNKIKSKVSFFIPCQNMYLGLVDMKTGKCNKDEAVKRILADREEVKHDKLKLAMLKQERPMFVEECFLSANDSIYDNEKIGSAIEHIVMNGLESEYMRVTLEWERNINKKKTGKITLKEDVNGKWLIHKEALPQSQYKFLDVAGIDDYMKDGEAKYSDSQGCMVVYRQPHHRIELSDLPICVYLDRPRLRSIFQDNCLKTAAFYGCKVLIELVDLTMARKFEESGYQENILYVNKKPGIEQSDKTIAEQTRLVEKWFEKDRHLNCTMRQIFEALKIWRRKNTDIGSSFHLAMQAMDIMRGDATEEVETENPNEKPVLFHFQTKQEFRRGSGMFAFS